MSPSIEDNFPLAQNGVSGPDKEPSTKTTNLAPLRREFFPGHLNVAAPSSSQQFKTRCEKHKPLALNWDHRLSQESASRTGSSLKAAFKHLQDPRVISLGGGLPLGEYFPFDSIALTVPSLDNLHGSVEAQAHNSVLHSGKHDIVEGRSFYDLAVALNYCQGSGSPQLLRWITEHTEMVHDPPYADWQCTMTIGNTSALDMALRMFTQRGDYVLSDEYTFASAVETASPMGVKFAGVEMDDQGMLPGSLRSVLENWDPAARHGAPRPFLVYAIPTGQNPTGATQGLQRRKDLYEVARDFDLIILEDDPYYFLQLEPYVANASGTNTPPPAHRAPEKLLEMIVPTYLSLDTDGRVVRMDSFSKVVSPGARVGWVTASQQLVERYKNHADVSTQSPSGVSQLALYKLLDEHWGHAGYFSWLLHLRREYTLRRDFTIRACEEFLPGDVVSWTPSGAGMFQWLKVDWTKHPQAGSKSVAEIEEELWLESIKEGSLVARGSWFHVPGDKSTQGMFFRITFAAAPLDKIEEAISRFGAALRRTFHME